MSEPNGIHGMFPFYLMLMLSPS